MSEKKKIDDNLQRHCSTVAAFPDRLPDESPQAYDAFLVFLNLGRGRSIDKAYRTKTKKKGRAGGKWFQWSSKHQWVERAETWDKEQERIDREAMATERQALARKHAQIAAEMLRAVVDALKVRNLTDPTETSFAALVRFFEVVVKMEREALGIFDQTTEEINNRIDNAFQQWINVFGVVIRKYLSPEDQKKFADDLKKSI